ncbi:MAG: class I SAM-dependent methyltransferase [Deltaproteobacteria bacterium]|nr:class I SAM-dependent methyltransferase [Deltaproteobacteria bacterium]
MSIPPSYSFTRYLAAKKSVDDRALNWQVWRRLLMALPRATAERPLRILEVGAGIGSMVQRLLVGDVLTHATYTAIDLAPDLIAEAYRRLPQWADEQGFHVHENHEGQLIMRRAGRHITIEIEAIDVTRFMAREHGRRAWDLLIGQAFLDSIDMPTTLPALCSQVRAGGLLYFPITFDGGTMFQPEGDVAFDGAIETCYHQMMDQRVLDGEPSGDSRAGRHLFTQLRTAGAEILAAGSSDWVVFAGANGYLADEAYFLHYIIHTVATALTGHPQLDAERLSQWVAQRHAQIERGKLVYIAHQLDVLGRVPEAHRK